MDIVIVAAASVVVVLQGLPQVVSDVIVKENSGSELTKYFYEDVRVPLSGKILSVSLDRYVSLEFIYSYSNNQLYCICKLIKTFLQVCIF